MGERSFEAVFLAEYGGLARLAAVISGDPSRSEELVQDAFAAALPRWADLERPGAYVRRSVVNRAINARQRGSAARNATLDDIDAPLIEPTSESDPDDDELRHLLATLSSVQRAVVALRFYLDLPLAEISTLMARPVNTVKSDLRRALATLAQEISR